MDQVNAPLPVITTVTIDTPYNAVGPVDEIQEITFDLLPDGGSWKLTYGVNETGTLTFNASAAAIQTSIRLIAGLSSATVTGNYATGFAITLVGVASPGLLSVSSNTLTHAIETKFLIDYWDGTEWQAAVDLLDSSNGLHETAMLQFSLNNKYGWHEVGETDDDSTNCPDEFVGLFINDCYWLRISFDPTADVPNPLTKIKKICYAFTTTDVVNSIDVEGPSYYDAILEGKTNWVNEIITASEMMVSDLKRIGFIKSEGQIIEFDEIYLACAYKTLMHIYFQLGKAYATQMAIMSNKYEKALSSKALTFDNDQDGKISRREIASTETRMVR
jgi:hypothetical protein